MSPAPAPDRGPRSESERRGRRAETIAAWLLRLKGFSILERRFATPFGEIDLVARRGRLIAFVEVKSRQTTAGALEALGEVQRRRIARAAEIYLQRHPACRDLDCRFDLIAVGKGLPRHVAEAWRL